MREGNHRQFGAAVLAKRLHDRFGRANVGNGTPLSAALADALELDLRISGAADGASRLAALTEEELDDLAFELTYAVQTKRVDFTLPLGTVFASREIGDLTVGGEHWLLDAGRPGLHPMESMRRDAHGPNLDLLLSHIRRLTRRLRCRNLGLPSAVRIVEVDDRNLLQFPAFEGAGGVVLQRWANGTDAPRFCSALPTQIVELAESIVADMRMLWKRRKAIGERARQVRAMADAAAAKHGAKVALVAIDLSHRRDDDQFDMYVHYEAIDEAMRPGPVLDFVPHWRGGEHFAYQGPLGVVYRREDLAALRALGADGRIDDMAAAVAAAAPRGLEAVFAELAQAYETMVELPTSGAPMFATLYWRDGTIKAEVSMAGRLDLSGDRLELLGEIIPASIMGGLAGRTVSSVVELPFDCPCVIKSADELNQGVRLEVEVGTRLIHLSTGRMWDEPQEAR